MSSVLVDLQSKLSNPAIPWQTIVIGVNLLVNAWENYIRLVLQSPLPNWPNMPNHFHLLSWATGLRRSRRPGRDQLAC